MDKMTAGVATAIAWMLVVMAICCHGRDARQIKMVGEQAAWSMVPGGGLSLVCRGVTHLRAGVDQVRK